MLEETCHTAIREVQGPKIRGDIVIKSNLGAWFISKVKWYPKTLNLSACACPGGPDRAVLDSLALSAKQSPSTHPAHTQVFCFVLFFKEDEGKEKEKTNLKAMF